jgi:hypothetical protein
VPDDAERVRLDASGCRASCGLQAEFDHDRRTIAMNPIRRSSDLLPSPSRLCGLARTLDLWASVDPWPWHGSFALDARALYRDWEIIGADLVDASLRLRSAMLPDDRWPQIGAVARRARSIPVRLPLPETL